MLNHPTKKPEKDHDPAQPGDLARLVSLDWIGHYLMGKMGIILSVEDDICLDRRICFVLFGGRIIKVLEDDLIIESRANQNERGTM